jgi:hypothetical protein
LRVWTADPKTVARGNISGITWLESIVFVIVTS